MGVGLRIPRTRCCCIYWGFLLPLLLYRGRPCGCGFPAHLISCLCPTKNPAALCLAAAAHAQHTLL